MNTIPITEVPNQNDPISKTDNSAWKTHLYQLKGGAWPHIPPLIHIEWTPKTNQGSALSGYAHMQNFMLIGYFYHELSRYARTYIKNERTHKLSGYDSLWAKQEITYDIPLAMNLVSHEPDIQVPSPPETVGNIFDYSHTVPECECNDNVHEVYDSISDEPKLFSRSELNDLVRDLNLPEDSAEVLGSR